MSKIKVRPYYWHDWFGGWEFDTWTSEIELDEELVEKYKKLESEYQDVCVEIYEEVRKQRAKNTSVS